MNRRTAFKNLALAAGSLIILPSWMVESGLAKSTTYSSGFSLLEQSVIAAITDAIIPKGNALGALETGVDKYLQKLIEDCYEPAVIQNVKQQLNAIDLKSAATFKKPFTEVSLADRQQLLTSLGSSTDKVVRDFFDLMKSETVRGFTTSQKVMTQYLGYRVAPGHYYGSVPV